MKIIHCADLHLDSKIETLPTEKSKIRREEIVRTFERLVDFAKQNEVRAVIIAGDMFDTKRVTVRTRERVLQAVKQAPSVDFIYLSGNHDDENFIENEGQLPENFKVVLDDWTKFVYGNVVISSVKLSSLNEQTVYDNLYLSENDVNIVALHGQIADYISSEKAEKISLPKLKDKHIDYLALGHIHERIVGKLDLRGKYAYSGCLDGRGFDELEEKGFFLLNIDGKNIKEEFINFSSRVLHEFEYDVTDKNSWIEVKNDIISLLENKIDKSSLIKVVIKGSHGTDFDVDKQGLSSRLNELFFFAKVYDRTELKINADDYLMDKSVRGEFVRVVLESDLTSEEKSKIIMCGINAIKGEDF